MQTSPVPSTLRPLEEPESDAVIEPTVYADPDSEGERFDEAPSGIERRAHDRFDFATEVSFETESNFYTGFTENISSGGLFIATWDLHPLGAPIDILLELPDGGPPIITTATVRWLREGSADGEMSPGMGVEFGTLSQWEQDRINEFIQSREAIVYID